MGTSILAILLGVFAAADTRVTSRPGAMRKSELDYQKQNFKQWWGIELVRKLDDLKAEGKVPDFRVPYSGHDYPDKGGGTDARTGRGPSAMGKYDLAFHDGRGLAVAWERQDVSGRKNRPGGRRRERLMDPTRPVGLFERLRSRRAQGWYGHCNGWTAAAMRHAEPQKSVTRNGIVFTPSDIKALLAEVYMYADTEFLGGEDPVINPGVFHVALANWLGRGSHPVGMDNTLGRPTFNYPIHKYRTAIKKLSATEAEVKLWATRAVNTTSEHDKSPRKDETDFFHYVLELDAEGRITGGRYYDDSERIDMLWAALKPTQGGEKGNERGCPHIDTKEVLAIWRASVPEDLRKKWLNIDPTEEDRLVDDPPPKPATKKPPPSKRPPAAKR